MPPAPTLPLSPGSLRLDEFAEPILVDPSPRLLRAVVDAYREAAPALVAPDVSTLGNEAARASDENDERGEDLLETGLPPLTVLARERAFDAATAGFHPASRLAALVDAEVVALRVVADPQPNVAIAGVDGGCVLVEDGADRYRIGDDPKGRDRYAPVVAAADPYRLRTPSRRRLYRAIERRCDDALASDVIRTLDVGSGDDGESLDRAEARCRTYAVGARHGTLDHALRRACEDAGLGSRATFTRIKKELRDAELIDTESVPQPVGRPRQRLVARGALADARSVSQAVEALREAVE